MKKNLLFLTFAIVVALVSCKKLIEQKKQGIALDAMTTGHWYVEQYKTDSVNVTGDFFGFEFQFYRNGTVDGIKGATTQSTGTWSADMNNYTITAAFPLAAGDTLRRLNYMWKITDSYLDYVVAITTPSAGHQNILHLRKK